MNVRDPETFEWFAMTARVIPPLFIALRISSLS